MRIEYTNANSHFYQTGDNKPIIDLATRALNYDILMQIGSPGRVATIEEICDALQVAYDYYLITKGRTYAHDYRPYLFINVVRDYIRQNNIDVNRNNGQILHTAVALGAGML